MRQTAKQARKQANVFQGSESGVERALDRESTLVLTASESEAFADAILNPRDPGPVLRKAAREYLEKIEAFPHQRPRRRGTRG